jgi:hypothetical protein
MNVDNRYQNAFAPWHGCSTMTHDELAALRIRAWHEQGILVISPSDKRLSHADRIVLCNIADRLYGTKSSP